jgi:outer membrane immunogenic protein
MFDFGNIESSHQIPGFPSFRETSRVKDVFTVTGRVGSRRNCLASSRVAVRGPAPIRAFSARLTQLLNSPATIGPAGPWVAALSTCSVLAGRYLANTITWTSDIALFAAFVFADTLSSHLTVQQALVGVNYKFNWGWGGAPVAAQY